MLQVLSFGGTSLPFSDWLLWAPSTGRTRGWGPQLGPSDTWRAVGGQLSFVPPNHPCCHLPCRWVTWLRITSCHLFVNSFKPLLPSPRLSTAPLNPLVTPCLSTTAALLNMGTEGPTLITQNINIKLQYLRWTRSLNTRGLITEKKKKTVPINIYTYRQTHRHAHAHAQT